MAFNPFEQYGIKEVADVIVYDLSDSKPVMFFDTLKISSIEQTSDQTDARGGKGNAKLISWDFGKEINVSLQDALISMKSLNLMLADGSTNVFHSTNVAKRIKKAEIVTLGSAKEFVPAFEPAGDVYVLEGATTATTTTSPTGGHIFAGGSSGDVVRIVYETNSLTGASGGGTYEIVISPDRFPGTYMFVGDTIIRNRTTGKDEGFQFIIPRAKMSSEVNLTLEAEGDPSVFDMNITVLKADNGSMMSLVKYDIGSVATTVRSNLT